MLDRVKIENILQHCDKSELISLVKRLLDRHPDLEYLLLMVRKEETLVNPQVHRRRVDAEGLSRYSVSSRAIILF